MFSSGVGLTWLLPCWGRVQWLDLVILKITINSKGYFNYLWLGGWGLICLWAGKCLAPGRYVTVMRDPVEVY